MREQGSWVMSACAVDQGRGGLWPVTAFNRVLSAVRSLRARQRAALEFMVLASLTDDDLAALGLDRSAVQAELEARAD